MTTPSDLALLLLAIGAWTASLVLAVSPRPDETRRGLAMRYAACAIIAGAGLVPWWA